MTIDVLRYAAFTAGGVGGNPAGVVLGADDLSDAEMQAVATRIGYSETAFISGDPMRRTVRYFAPAREVPFCGHATIAAAVALAEREGIAPLVFETPVGRVPVATRRDDGGIVAELTSVPPRVDPPTPGLVDVVLEALDWAPDDLDPAYPPRVADAGARHLILVTTTRGRLANLAYDVDRLGTVMTGAGLITVALVWPESLTRWHARNPFPVGGVVEDPATGAAAAALGGYLRHLGALPEEAVFEISQGVDLGRPSLLQVRLVAGEAGVRVAGTADPIPA